MCLFVIGMQHEFVTDLISSMLFGAGDHKQSRSCLRRNFAVQAVASATAEPRAWCGVVGLELKEFSILYDIRDVTSGSEMFNSAALLDEGCACFFLPVSAAGLLKSCYGTKQAKSLFEENEGHPEFEIHQAKPNQAKPTRPCFLDSRAPLVLRRALPPVKACKDTHTPPPAKPSPIIPASNRAPMRVALAATGPALSLIGPRT